MSVRWTASSDVSAKKNDEDVEPYGSVLDSSVTAGGAWHHNGLRSKVFLVNNCRLLTLFLVQVLPFSQVALSHSNLVHTFKAAALSVRAVHDEGDADTTADCLTLGELDIMFRTHDAGLPNVGLVLTDPRGRRIGFDPLTKAAWDELPQAQGFIDCDRSASDDESCWGTVQVCGPLSGAYKLQVIGQKASTYTLRIFARTKQVLLRDGFHSSHSAADLTNVAIRKAARDVVVLNYSRDPDTKVAVQLYSMK